MSEISPSRVAYVLVLVGGVILLVLGILSFLGIGFDFGPIRWGWGYFAFAYSGIVMIICGIIALIGAKNVTALSWAIILLIVGIIGGGIGGLLVAIGAVIGLIMYVAKKA